MKLIHTTFALLPLLAACGAAPLAPQLRPQSPMIAQEAMPLKFQAIDVASLTSPAWNQSANQGKLVRFEGSFGAETFGDYGLVMKGYKIWDHTGHGLRCENIYSTIDKGGQTHDVGDLRPEDARWLLKPGTFVTVDGAYVPAPALNAERAKNPTLTAPDEPMINVYFINGEPVKDLVVNYPS